MKNWKTMAVGILALNAAAAGAQAACSDVVAELQAMRKAQSAIQSSLISNHEMFATSLDSYSDALSETSGRAHRTVSENMSRSSESFRERGLKAQKMALKLDHATAELIQKVSKCVK